MSGPPRPLHVTGPQRSSPFRRRITNVLDRASLWILKTVAGSLRVWIILETGPSLIMSSGEFSGLGDPQPGIGLPLTTSPDKVQFVIINHKRCSSNNPQAKLKYFSTVKIFV